MYPTKLNLFGAETYPYFDLQPLCLQGITEEVGGDEGDLRNFNHKTLIQLK